MGEPRPGQSERRRLVPRDPRRQHRLAPLGPDRARSGCDLRADDPRRGRAEHGLVAARAHPVRHGRSDALAQHGQHGRQLVDHDGGTARPDGGCSGLPGAPRARLCEPRRPGREPHGQQGRRLGRREDRHLRAVDRRQAVQRHLLGNDPDCGPGSGEGRQPVHAGRDRPPAAVRHPDHRHRREGLCRERARARNASRPDRAAARPGRLRCRFHSRPGDRGRELDQPHPECPDRAGEELPGRRRPARVRRDPGGCAAESQLADVPDDQWQREPLEEHARLRRGRPGRRRSSR